MKFPVDSLLRTGMLLCACRCEIEWCSHVLVLWTSMVNRLWATGKPTFKSDSSCCATPDFCSKFAILIAWVWVGGCLYLRACVLAWMEERFSSAKTQVCGLGVIPSHILCSISYLMAFLPCKSHQKLANNSTTLTDAQASGEPPLWMFKLLWTTCLQKESE